MRPSVLTRGVQRHGDATVAVLLFVLAQIELSARHPQHSLVDVIRGLLLAGATLPIAWRRTRPLTAVAVTSVLGIAVTILTGNVDIFYAPAATALIGYYSAGAHAQHRSWLAPTIGCLAFWTGDVAAGHPPNEYVASAVLVIGPWLAGRAIGHQRRQAAQLRDLADELAQERQSAEQAAVAGERARIAREMHDVVAHALSIIAVQADGASAALEVQPALAAPAIETIRSVSRESLDEMRRVLHVLHEDPAHSPTMPPTLRDLNRLIARSEDSGLAVHLHVRGTMAGLPPALDLAAYRVVQEALTNVHKHSAEPQAEVRVERTQARLLLEVISYDCPGPTSRKPPMTSPAQSAKPSGGYGLRGLRDRVEAHGGVFEAGSTSTGWRLAAQFPLPAIPVPAGQRS